jgi:hypothetical protein
MYTGYIHHKLCQKTKKKEKENIPRRRYNSRIIQQGREAGATGVSRQLIQP